MLYDALNCVRLFVVNVSKSCFLLKQIFNFNLSLTDIKRYYLRLFAYYMY